MNDRVHPDPVSIEVVLDDDPAAILKSPSSGVAATSSLRALMHLLSQEVTTSCIDRQAGKLLMLHAGAVAHVETSRAIAVVAPSGTGKTTFVRTLGKHRAYLSDETVGLREGNVVVPYCKPLSTHSEDPDGFKDQVSPDAFDLQVPTQDATLADLWFLNRVNESIEPRIERLPTLDALTTIAPQISYLSSTPNPLRRLSATFDAVGGMKYVTYTEAADLEPYVLAALRSHE